MRLVKIIFSIILIALLLLIGLVSFVDPNRYKPDIVNAVQKSIHQPFAINGDIKWHLWPEFGLSLHDVQIGHPDSLLQVQAMNIEVMLLPLLRQEVDMLIRDIAIHWHHDALEEFTATAENINISVKGLTRAPSQITIDTIHIDHFEAQKIYFDLFAMLSGLTFDHIIIHHLSIDKFALNKMLFTSLDTQVNIQKNIIALKPFNAELFSGKVTGDMVLNLQKPNPESQINAHLQQVDLKPLLTYMAPDNEITGVIDMDLKVSSTGLDSQLLQQHAQGHANIHIEQCIYHGAHYGKAITDTVAAVNNLKDAEAMLVDSVTLSQAMLAQNHEGNKITGTLTIHHGAVDALDLMLNNQYPIKRYGTIDLAHQLIDLCFDFQKKPSTTAQ